MSSPSSSSSGRRGALALAAAAAVACGHSPGAPATSAAPPPRRPVAVMFPVQNYTGGRAPVRALTAALEREVAASGLDVLAGEVVDRFLAERRIRYTGGVDGDTAALLRDQLGVDGVLVSSVDAYALDGSPRIALSSRLVSTEDRPRIEWMNRVSLAGSDAPGLFGVGVVTDMPRLQAAALSRLVRTLVAGQARRQACPGGGRFGPRRSFRSPVLDEPDRLSIAVLPFVSESGRRDAGEVVALELIRQLVSSRAFEVVEPGMVRRELLSYRLILEGGVSLDNAMVVLEQLQADLVLSGSVLEYAESARTGTPAVQFTAYVLDRRTHKVVWSSTSTAHGDDGVFFFGLGRMETAGALSCRMAREVVERIAGGRPKVVPDSIANLAPGTAPRAESAPQTP